MGANRIILTEDDFAEDPKRTAGQPQRATGPPIPPTRPLPPIKPTEAAVAGQPITGKIAPGTNVALDRRTSFLLAAAIGVVTGWLATIIFGVNEPKLLATPEGIDRHVALWTAAFGIFYGTTVLSFDRLVAGAWEAAGKRAAIAAAPFFGISYVAGYAAQALYGYFIGQIDATTYNDYRFYLLRMAGWVIFGLGIGLTVGLVDRSRSRTINSAIGGLLGGGLGGLLFQAASANLHTSNDVSQLIGLATIGLLIAVATRAVETVLRQAWVHVLAGGMAGKEFILYHAFTRIGSSPDCEIFLLKDPAVAKVHAQIEDRNGQRVLTVTPGALVVVNGTSVSSQVLRSGDRVQIGGTLLGYSERSASSASAMYGNPS
jgi:hypothetical protein